MINDTIEDFASSPLDQKRIVLTAVARLADLIDEDTGITLKNFKEPAVHELRSVITEVTDAVKCRRLVLKCLFGMAEKLAGDSGVALLRWRSDLARVYESEFMQKEDDMSCWRSVSAAMSILCQALDGDVGVARKNFTALILETA